MIPGLAPEVAKRLSGATSTAHAATREAMETPMKPDGHTTEVHTADAPTGSFNVAQHFDQS